jgi:hypothetical protein
MFDINNILVLYQNQEYVYFNSYSGIRLLCVEKNKIPDDYYDLVEMVRKLLKDESIVKLTKEDKNNYIVAKSVNRKKNDNRIKAFRS